MLEDDRKQEQLLVRIRRVGVVEPFGVEFVRGERCERHIPTLPRRGIRLLAVG
jgi:hypothetical protein